MEDMVLLKNGKTLDDALSEIREYKEPTEFKLGKPYYDIDEYVERMDLVLGRANYNSTYSEMQIVSLPTGQAVLSCKCHIDFIGKDGNIAFSCEGYGSWDIAVSSDTGQFINLTTVSMNCGTSAFKSACRDIGIFECRKKDKKGKGKGQKSGSNSSNAKTGSTSKQSQKETFFLDKPLMEMWKDRETGKPAYRMIARIVEDTVVTEKVCEVLVYPNQYKKQEQKLNELIIRSKECQNGFRVSMMVTDVDEDKRGANYAASFVFKEFVGAK